MLGIKYGTTTDSIGPSPADAAEFALDRINLSGMSLQGGASGDYLEASATYARLYGGAGNDVLVGDGNANLLAGGTGNDTLTGGAAADMFRFGEAGSTNADVITDFVSGSDKIQLDNAFFSTLGADGALGAGVFGSSADNSFLTGTQRLHYNTATGELWYDADGSATGSAPMLIATLNHGGLAAAGVNSNDFIVI